MIGIDTNVLVRYVTHDDEAQWQKASKYLQAHCSAHCPGWICGIVLCETVWVLSSGYGYEKSQICALLDRILYISELKVENRDCVKEALESYQTGQADFSDYLISAINKMNGCKTTVTFDKKAGKHSGFKLL